MNNDSGNPSLDEYRKNNFGPTWKRAMELWHEYDKASEFSDCDWDEFVKIISEALSLAYKQGALARISGPSDIERDSRALNYYYENGGTANKRKAHGAAGHFEDGAKWYRDSLKITPLTTEDILPSDDEFVSLLRLEGSHGTYKWLHGFVTAKLDGK